jgi:uncharacterized Zn-finger protein
MFCVGISGEDPENFTMELPLLILPALNADFDGDSRPIHGMIRLAVLLDGNIQCESCGSLLGHPKAFMPIIKEREQKQVKRFGKDDSKSYTK